jgi:transcriptional regulator with XRE-family HTH domain
MNRSRQEIHRRLLQKTLREARTKAGLRQEDVAHKLGQPQSFVSKYETGERQLDLAELWDVCAVLGISLVSLIQQIEEQTR